MNIILNGEQMNMTDGLSLSALVIELGLQDKKIAIEVNETIISASQFERTQLSEGDQIEIVQAIGGG